ncbi:DNA topoisomerase I [Bacillus sp. RO2]|uniref:NERD domain-containing protein n=1 Tax=Bacillus sp. RO2 TaxID=2723913 RepID=UPI00145C6AD5|nr:NERD domain-containing protein [Bacillus sp. RO2]NMH73931.1 DNA topoisomerase I [Bacillus sp. RO2]
MAKYQKAAVIFLSIIIVLPVLYFIIPIALPFLFLAGMVYLKANYARIKGAVGERAVNKELEKLGPLFTVYHDLYVPNENGGTSQVDHVVTSPTGIFVIETKHYDGWIFGKENQRNWTQVIYKRKEKFLNPIWQNYGHIKALKGYLGEHHNYQSIIAFSSQSTLKFEDDFTSARVIQIPQLNKIIKESLSRQISEVELRGINKALEQLIIQDGKQKKMVHKRHIEAIRDKQAGNVVVKPIVKKQTLNQTEAETCPECGGKLSIKKGKYGSFYGCSGYPGCRFTAKIS